jgi:hypothetical protein
LEPNTFLGCVSSHSIELQYYLMAAGAAKEASAARNVEATLGQRARRIALVTYAALTHPTELNE